MSISAIDLFCGVGGLSYGLKKSGINILAGVDLDDTCEFAYSENCKAEFIHESIDKIKGEVLQKKFKKGSYKLLAGCAPCQPFSSYTYKSDKNKDSRWQLLYEFSRLIVETEPDFVTMENVPTLLKFKAAPVFRDFVKKLEGLGYSVWYDVVFAPDYGIPQNRKRLVLLASKHGKIELISPTHKREEYLTVYDAIGHLEKIKDGECSKTDIIHKAAKLTELNLRRIQQSKPGGSWKTDWDEELKLACHISEKGKGYGSVYGRMKWDEPSPTMTTFCNGIGNGRFGHPEQDRAISLREAAILQSFPEEYKFASNAGNLVSKHIAKHIGNAVPPRLGEVIGISFQKHIEALNYDKKKKK
ncbi:MAG: DNA (cytosine-5-)-methyltransferase [Bacteroidales bacterium]|nr:DNA (cytosine-5-)-methyltransferase [Bacteroidales bacterium]MBN2750895.1 DNA (cytosine-5-)-methyltransferase [Bacteroidales bacterium]